VNTPADVVIVGGGVIGSSIAWNLKRDGFTGSVVVVERDPSYQFASSALAMGGVREQYMSAVNVAMAQYSIRLYEQTPEVDFRQRGYLFLGNKENWARLQRRYEVEKSLGVRVELLNVNDVRKLVPELRCDDLVGAVFGKKDGYIDNRKVLRFLRTSAESAGAVYLADEVRRIDIARGAVKAVHANKTGRIETDRLVIASGAYSGALGEIAGVPIPVTPVRQQIFRCELPRKWTYEFPMTIDPGGVHWRSYGENEITIMKTKPDEPPGIRFGGDIDRFYSDFMPDLIRRLPEFKDLKLVFGWGGLYEMTPDQNGIIDQHPEVSGLYVACGFSGHGLMTSPATGKLMSELIRLGRFETVEASPLSYTRFEQNRLFFDEAMI
jgi:glycine/D-amino acid oxidase-like deaminating enzyme